MRYKLRELRGDPIRTELRRCEQWIEREWVHESVGGAKINNTFMMHWCLTSFSSLLLSFNNSKIRKLWIALSHHFHFSIYCWCWMLNCSHVFYCRFIFIRSLFVFSLSQSFCIYRLLLRLKTTVSSFWGISAHLRFSKRFSSNQSLLSYLNTYICDKLNSFFNQPTDRPKEQNRRERKKKSSRMLSVSTSCRLYSHLVPWLAFE